jgi:cytochrome c-type biogenesis protein CcmH
MARLLAASRRALSALAILPVLVFVVVFGQPLATARDAPPAAQDPAIEQRMLRIASELRCLVCQNQTIADSHSGLAEDLREEVRVMLRKGQSDEQVVAFMTDRYGDFVRYRPPVKASTWLLWFGPGVLMVGGLVALWVVLRRRSQLPDADFEPDVDAAGQPSSSP